MKYRSLYLLVLAFSLLCCSARDNVFAGPTPFKTSLSNYARVFAVNYLYTNWAGTNVVVAEIRGIMNLVASNTNGYLIPGEQRDFDFALTNKANIREKKLLLVLTNCRTNTNTGCGNWTVKVVVEGQIIFLTNSRKFSTAGGVEYLFLTNTVPPGDILDYGLRLTAPADAGPNAWISVQLIARVTTNAAGYQSPDNTPYGGKTNIVNSVRLEVAGPNISLSKVVEKVTNYRYGGNPLMPGAELWYCISFSNSGTGPGENFCIIDVLPQKNIQYSNNMILSGFAANFGIKYSDDKGLTWNYNPVAWDTNVDSIQFCAVSTFTNGSSGTIRYRIRIK